MQERKASYGVCGTEHLRRWETLLALWCQSHKGAENNYSPVEQWVLAAYAEGVWVPLKSVQSSHCGYALDQLSWILGSRIQNHWEKNKRNYTAKNGYWSFANLHILVQAPDQD